MRFLCETKNHGTIFGTKKKNNKKITQAGGVGNQRFPLALSAIL